MSGKRLLLFVIISLFLFLGVALVLGIPGDFNINIFKKGTSDTTPQDEEVDSNISTPDVSFEERPVVKFETSSTEWEQDSEYELSVSYEELTELAPNAITLQIIYDPEYVQVVEISEGDLWTGTNVLQKKIDNENGEVLFSAGQDFSADVTGNITLANFNVKVIKAGLFSVETQFELGSESAMTSVGVDRLIMLQGLPVKIKIKR